jgi:hypothetical protein
MFEDGRAGSFPLHWSQYWHQLQKIIVQPKFCSGVPCYTNIALPEDGIYRQMAIVLLIGKMITNQSISHICQTK